MNSYQIADLKYGVACVAIALGGMAGGGLILIGLVWLAGRVLG